MRQKNKVLLLDGSEKLLSLKQTLGEGFEVVCLMQDSYDKIIELAGLQNAEYLAMKQWPPKLAYLLLGSHFVLFQLNEENQWKLLDPLGIHSEPREPLS